MSLVRIFLALFMVSQAVALLRNNNCYTMTRLNTGNKFIPESEIGTARKSLFKSLSVTASAVLLLSSGVLARTFEPIERGQRPDISEAAILPPNGAQPDYAAVRKDIEDLIKAKPDKGPTLVRLAWHSSGTVRRSI
jgi:hypothetical protein